MATRNNQDCYAPWFIHYTAFSLCSKSRYDKIILTLEFILNEFAALRICERRGEEKVTPPDLPGATKASTYCLSVPPRQTVSRSQAHFSSPDVNCPAGFPSLIGFCAIEVIDLLAAVQGQFWAAIKKSPPIQVSIFLRLPLPIIRKSFARLYKTQLERGNKKKEKGGKEEKKKSEGRQDAKKPEKTKE